MPYVRIILAALCASAIVGVTGCGTAPQKPVPKKSVGAMPAVETKAEAPVSNVARTDYERALNAVKAGREREAEQALLAMGRAYPDLSGPRANLGILYFRLGKFEEAEQALVQAIKINPERPAYYNQLGIVYRARGRFDDARKAYEKALRVDPNYSKAHLNIGILYDLYLNDLAKALQHYERYQQLHVPVDKQVAKWIVDLNQRTRTTDKPGKKENG